jgi:hypothetical protein
MLQEITMRKTKSKILLTIETKIQLLHCVINAMILSIKLRIAKVGHNPLVKNIILSSIPPKFGGRNKRRALRKNVI